MSECRSIEPLLYLHREGELTRQEEERVRSHVAGCPACRAILADLGAMDEVVAPLRRETVSPVPEVQAVLDAVTTRRAVNEFPDLATIGGRFLDWAFPAVRIAATTLVLLFVVQQARDASRLSNLERRMHEERSGTAGADAEERRLLALAASARSGEHGLPTPALASDPIEFMRGGLTSLFAGRPGLFDEFARRYPDLARITTSDTLSARERAIIATQGRALLSDIQDLIRKGER